MYPELAGKVAVITGSGRPTGLGAAMARRLAEEGCRIVISDIGQSAGPETPPEAIGASDEMNAMVEEIRALGAEAVAIACNVLEEDQVQALIDRTVEHFGRIDILVNNAGIGYIMKPIVEMETSDWDAVLGVNLRGVFLATRAAARQMIKQGNGGRIINIASQAAKSGFPFAAGYCSSKHGLVGLTRVAAIEMGQHGINVNAICPNHVTTGLGAWQNEYFSKALGMSLDEYMAAMKGRIPLGRPGLQEDTAKACAFLCSDQAVYITGEAMNVSGGEEYH
ncbi:MAG: SDR family oxidoreductase [Wenzhouxiangella sp.]|nr:SDR family oxidoreductase [Wenzhouxiangella sp.]MCH8479065.1 SDR family oxidoreductase [Wenzhouxiangella sp.]TVQ37893.1 MAG: SDR family oxidoreductase [Wenzhouxiangella sp.]